MWGQAQSCLRVTQWKTELELEENGSIPEEGEFWRSINNIQGYPSSIEKKVQILVHQEEVGETEFQPHSFLVGEEGAEAVLKR